MLRFVCGRIVCKTACFASMRADDFIRQFGQKVRAAREARGLSQEALAHAAGLHQPHISLIERGQRSGRLETIEKLATALGRQPASLMPKVRLRM